MSNSNTPSHPPRQSYESLHPVTAKPCDEEVWLRGFEISLKYYLSSGDEIDDTGMDGVLQAAEGFLARFKSRWP